MFTIVKSILYDKKVTTRIAPLIAATMVVGVFGTEFILELSHFNQIGEKRKIANKEWRNQKLLDIDYELAACAKQKPAEECISVSKAKRSTVDKKFEEHEEQIKAEWTPLSHRLKIIIDVVMVAVLEVLTIKEIMRYLRSRKELEKEDKPSRHLKAVP